MRISPNLRLLALLLCALLLCAVLPLTLASCANAPYIEGGGVDIRGTTAASTSASSDTEPGGPSDPDTVYWVVDGSVYHYSPDCTYLNKSSDIRSGARSICPIERDCDRCRPTETTTIPETTTSIENSSEPDVQAPDDEDIVVYYVKSGGVFHIAEDCSYLAKSKEILSALLSLCPVRKPCSLCAKDFVMPAPPETAPPEQPSETASAAIPADLKRYLYT